MAYRKHEAATNMVASCPLPNLIAHNAPLTSGSLLVLMYERLQFQMSPTERQGVGSWIKECVDKHGLPSLIRFGHRDRATVFRKDEFTQWFTPLMAKKEA
ncbi:hypothetical protein [Candidatus Cyanaurora vandensis]|uniref:hypothetical protein n=1 Tax=Candidatus Cyanaurora vandensis TaxID=2714958 RepID=UPI002580C2B2|nr:hypothetical protein [Candidatus Cyanaurora vandensis]